MAFGLLTTLPPICGMYTAFFGPLTYFFLGTSRHLSMGKDIIFTGFPVHFYFISVNETINKICEFS
jgi:MFS superfamily sulfate permease-like transporter